MRAWIWAIVGVALWGLAVHVQRGPTPVPDSAPASAFSAMRAKAALHRLLPEDRPRPTGTAEDAAVHDRLLRELAAMGVQATSYARMSCYEQQRYGTVLCGGINDIIAEVLPGQGKAVVLMAHLDSVPAGPGAGDDGTGMATLLETIRALKGAPSRHPVIAVFTDGEENGLLGANAFVRNPAWRARVGVVLNIDARGNQGESLLFQTSPKDSALIDLYAEHAPHPATSSLFGEVYKMLPNDTDMTPVLRAGLPGYNFANVGNIAVYHTRLDRFAALDPRSLQSHGDNVLGLTRALAQTDFAALQGSGAIYMDLLGVWLPRLPVGWALPLSALAFVAIALIGWRRRDVSIVSLLMPPAVLLGAAASATVLQKLASFVGAQPDPSYAQPGALRLALAWGVLSVALFAARRATLTSSWLWLACMAVITAAFLPGASPYFLFPELLAVVTLPFATRWPWLVFLPTLVALAVWMQLAASVETLLGLAQPLPFALAVAGGAIAALPVLQDKDQQAAMLCAGVAMLAALVAGYLPAYDAAHPQRLNLFYVEDSGKAQFVASPVDHLPKILRTAAHFSATPQRGIERGYTAPAGASFLPPPAVMVTRQGHDVALDLHGSAESLMMMVTVPKDAGLRSVTIGDASADAPDGPVTIYCSTPDCAHARMVLHFADARPVQLVLMERRIGLPERAAALEKARPDWTTPSQYGDMTVLVNRLTIP